MELIEIDFKTHFPPALIPEIPLGNFLSRPEISDLTPRQFLNSYNFNLQALRGGVLHYTNMPINAMCSTFVKGCTMIIKINLGMSVQIMDNIKYSS